MTILSIFFFITAILYSSVGFGGGSTYLALMIILDVPYYIFPIIALICNIIVVSGNSVNYIRSGNLNLRLLLPYLAGSIPFAFFGASILIEKEFRQGVDEIDWESYCDKYVFVHCSADAIVPLWAFMLVSLKLNPYAKLVVMGEQDDLERAIFDDFLMEHDFDQYLDKAVIVKGCGSHPIPKSVFIDFTNRLQGKAKSIMFGEACSAVPLFKKKKN